MALRFKSPFSGLALRLSHRWSRRRNNFPQTISMRRVFVLPKRHGFMVGFATLGVFAIALRIQNNMLLLLSVALFIVFLLSLIWAGRNIAGITLSLQPGQRLIAGQTGQLEVILRCDAPRHMVTTRLPTGRQKVIFRNGIARIAMPVNIDTRGRHAVPPLCLESDFPFGLARCWAWVTAGDVLVAPDPASGHERYIDQRGRMIGQDSDEDNSGADSLGEWINGTPQTRIHWKRFAATGRLLIKQGEAAAADRVTIDYARMKHLGHERALSTMCGAVLAAQQQQKAFVMLLPQHQVISENGQNEEALDALALA